MYGLYLCDGGLILVGERAEGVVEVVEAQNSLAHERAAENVTPLCAQSNGGCDGLPFRVDFGRGGHLSPKDSAAG